MQVNQFLEQSAQTYPDKPAVWYKDNWYTYATIEERANQVANYLKKSGIRRGDRVALLYENSTNYIISYFAILKAGGVVVAINTQSTVDSIVYYLNHSDAGAVISNQRFTRQLIPALQKTPSVNELIIDTQDLSLNKQADRCNTIRLDQIYDNMERSHPGVRSIDIDIEAIVYTSGSTGKPKGVTHTHLNVVSNMRAIVEYLHLTDDDRMMVVLPFTYIYGKSLLLTHFLTGGSVVIDNRFAYPNTILETMQKNQVTGFAGVPSTFMILLNKSMLSQYKFESIRYVTQAGGAMAPTIQKEVYRVFQPADVYIMYGATEAAPRMSYLDPAMLPQKWGSIGKPLPNVDLFIADSDGKELPQGEVGEIVARGSNIMIGYWEDPEGTAEVLRNRLYYTGDLGRMDEEGFFYVVGRTKEIIKAGGFRVSAKEVEETILESCDVYEAAVVGVDDPILGEAVKAFIVPKKQSLTENEIMKLLGVKLPPYKLPKYIEFCTSLPKNESGKVLKTALLTK